MDFTAQAVTKVIEFRPEVVTSASLVEQNLPTLDMYEAMDALEIEARQDGLVPGVYVEQRFRLLHFQLMEGLETLLG